MKPPNADPKDERIAERAPVQVMNFFRTYLRTYPWTYDIDRRDFSDAIEIAESAHDQLTARIAALEKERPRVERCIECGGFVSEWVEADHRNGRICRPCETVLILRAKVAELEGRLTDHFVPDRDGDPTNVTWKQEYDSLHAEFVRMMDSHDQAQAELAEAKKETDNATYTLRDIIKKQEAQLTAGKGASEGVGERTRRRARHKPIARSSARQDYKAGTRRTRHAPAGREGAAMTDEYIPYGDEWRAECMKLRKADLIDILKAVCAERDRLKEEKQDEHP